MLKQSVIKVVLAIALVLGGFGVWNAAPDSWGLPSVPSAYACTVSGHGGGGC